MSVNQVISRFWWCGSIDLFIISLPLPPKIKPKCRLTDADKITAFIVKIMTWIETCSDCHKQERAADHNFFPLAKQKQTNKQPPSKTVVIKRSINGHSENVLVNFSGSQGPNESRVMNLVLANSWVNLLNTYSTCQVCRCSTWTCVWLQTESPRISPLKKKELKKGKKVTICKTTGPWGAVHGILDA